MVNDKTKMNNNNQDDWEFTVLYREDDLVSSIQNSDDVDDYVNTISYKVNRSPITKITNSDPDNDNDANADVGLVGIICCAVTNDSIGKGNGDGDGNDDGDEKALAMTMIMMKMKKSSLSQ